MPDEKEDVLAAFDRALGIESKASGPAVDDDALLALAEKGAEYQKPAEWSDYAGLARRIGVTAPTYDESARRVKAKRAENMRVGNVGTMTLPPDEYAGRSKPTKIDRADLGISDYDLANFNGPRDEAGIPVAYKQAIEKGVRDRFGEVKTKKDAARLNALLAAASFRGRVPEGQTHHAIERVGSDRMEALRASMGGESTPEADQAIEALNKEYDLYEQAIERRKEADLPGFLSQIATAPARALGLDANRTKALWEFLGADTGDSLTTADFQEAYQRSGFWAKAGISLAEFASVAGPLGKASKLMGAAFARGAAKAGVTISTEAAVSMFGAPVVMGGYSEMQGGSFVKGATLGFLTPQAEKFARSLMANGNPYLQELFAQTVGEMVQQQAAGGELDLPNLLAGMAFGVGKGFSEIRHLHAAAKAGAKADMDASLVPLTKELPEGRRNMGLPQGEIKPGELPDQPPALPQGGRMGLPQGDVKPESGLEKSTMATPALPEGPRRVVVDEPMGGRLLGEGRRTPGLPAGEVRPSETPAPPSGQRIQTPERPPVVADPPDLGKPGTPGFTSYLKLRADLSEQGVGELRAEAKRLGISHGGSKKELVERIIENRTQRAQEPKPMVGKMLGPVPADPGGQSAVSSKSGFAVRMTDGGPEFYEVKNGKAGKKPVDLPADTQDRILKDLGIERVVVSSSVTPSPSTPDLKRAFVIKTGKDGRYVVTDPKGRPVPPETERAALERSGLTQPETKVVMGPDKSAFRIKTGPDGRYVVTDVKGKPVPQRTADAALAKAGLKQPVIRPEPVPEAKSEVAAKQVFTLHKGEDGTYTLRDSTGKAAPPETVAAAVKRVEVVERAEPKTAAERLVDTDPDVMPKDIPAVKTPDGEVEFMASMGNLRNVAAALGRPVKETADVIRRTWGEVVGRLKSHDVPAAKEATNRSVGVINDTKGFRGEMSEKADEALKRVRHHGLSMGGTAEVAGDTYRTGRLYDLIEGRVKPKNAREAKAVEAVRDVIDQRGELFERVGLQQQQADGSWSPFKRKGRNVAPRVFHPQFFDIIQRGPGGSAWGELVRVLGKTTGLGDAAISKQLTEMAKSLNGESLGGMERSAQAEMTRVWKEVPALIKVGGRQVQILETNPFRYVSRLVEAGTSRAAFIKHFGQDVGKGSHATRLRDEMGTKKGREDFAMVARLLNGLPQDQPIIDSGSALGAIHRGLKIGTKALKEGLLSASAVVNIPEPLGSTRSFAGNRGLAQAAWRLAKAIPGKLTGRYTALDAAERVGSRTAAVMNTTWDPRHPIESVVRIASEISGRVFGHRIINEGQESLAALAAMAKVEQFKARGAKGKAAAERDIYRLRAMGYDIEAARRLASGKGTDAEYDALVRDVPGRLVGSTSLPAERSWFEGSRITRPLVAFASYFHTIARDAARQHATFAKSMSEAVRGKDSSGAMTGGQRWKRAYAASRQMADFYLGKTAQGAAQYIITSTILYGADGTAATLEEAENNIGDFALKSLASSVVGGTFAAVGRAIGGENVEDQVFPIWAAKEVVGATFGLGKYEGYDADERVSMFLDRGLPIRRVWTSLMASAGYADAQALRKRKLADRTYYAWRADNLGTSDREGVTPDDPALRPAAEQREKFRLDMKRLFRAHASGASPEDIQAEFARALGSSRGDTKAMAQSLLARRYLSNLSDEQKASLRRRSPSLYPYFEAEDARLEAFAKSIK